MVGAWLQWVFDELVVPLLQVLVCAYVCGNGCHVPPLLIKMRRVQAFFYITEGSTSRHNLLYYLKHDWHAVWLRGIASLTTNVLTRVTKVRPRPTVHGSCGPKHVGVLFSGELLDNGRCPMPHPPEQEKLPHLLDSRTLTFSYSRLLPKPDGVRLIVNMSRRIGQVWPCPDGARAKP
jgi:hypothetical protein